MAEDKETMSGLATQRAAAVSFLESIGARDVDHSDDGLLAHLDATFDVLQRWGNSTDVCLAGLCHAVYGTDGFAVGLLDIEERDRLTAVIGPAAEALVYFYASCDRKFFYPLIGSRPLRFRDRFTAVEFEPPETSVRACLELMLANDVEIAYREKAFAEYTKKHFSRFFLKSGDFVSSAAFGEYCEVYGLAQS